jgi:serine/threonine protein kinase
MTVVTCIRCGAKNRTDEDTATRLQPVCGKCGATLSVTIPYNSSPATFRKDDGIGPYTLVHRIGHGGFGEVWLAEKSGIVTIRFALKLPKDDEIDPAIFKQEASVWVQASGHTNIVPIVEADAYPVKRDGVVLKSDQIVIVSEYLQDGSLEKRLQKYKNNVLPTETAVEISLGILAGLKYLHTRRPRIIHRDLKPDNVLLQGETPRLTDFGIARMLKTNSYSRTEQISGTLPYMAPEVFKGHYSVGTDVWATGVILYQLLSGRLPFPQPEIAALIWAIANDEPVPLPAAVPNHFRMIVNKALKKNPLERYRTADEMRQALVEAKQGGGSWGSTIPAPLPHPVPQPEPPAPKPLPISLWVVAAAVVLLSVFAFSFYITRKPGENASGTPSEKATPPAIIADTSNANSQTDGNPVSATPNMNGSVTVTGLVEFETSEGPLSAPQSGKIIEWLVKPGDFVNQIYKPIANYSYEREVPARVGDPNRYYESSVDHLDIFKPSIVKSISVGAGQEFTPGQELCRVGTVLHVWVKAKPVPYDLARVPIGSNAFFKTTSNIVFKGRVESVSVQEGVANIKLLDEHVFDSAGFLTLGPDTRGDVTFDASTAAR